MESDWPLVGVTMLVAITALLVPLVAEWLKRKVYAPRLEVGYQHASPCAVRTEWGSPLDPTLREPVHYFRVRVSNTGKSRAEYCEAVLEELYVYDASGSPQKLEGLLPQNLRWAGTGESFAHINPRRSLYVDIGHISSRAHQAREERKLFIDVPGRGGDSLRMLLDQVTFPLAQPNCLAPGRYRLKIVVYSEDAPSVSIRLDVSWTGNWQDAQAEMLRELVIKPVKR